MKRRFAPEELLEDTVLKKMKVVVGLVVVAVLLVVCVLLVRFVGGMLVVATDSLSQDMSTEAPVDEETWIAPTMAPETPQEYDDGMSRVQSETPDDDGDSAGYVDADEDLESVPVDQTLDQLADTSADSSVARDLTSDEADQE